jgi:protein-tyrosine-phosphatase
MQPVQIAIACRQNRVRSPFVYAALHKMAPHDLFSFGSQARASSYPSDLVCDLIAELGFHQEWQEVKRSQCRSLKDVELLLRDTSVVLCLDQSILDDLTNAVDEAFTPKLTLANGDDDFLTAVDPVHLNKDETRLEVYKVTLKSIQTLRKLGLLKSNKISAYLPKTESDLSTVIDSLLARPHKGNPHVVVSLDFYSPLAGRFEKSGFKVVSLSNISDLRLTVESGVIQAGERLFIGVDYEIPWTYGELYSQLHEISLIDSNKCMISFILPNLDSNLRISSIAILGSWFANQVEFFGSSIPRFAKGLAR